jgi:hypothetical protein
MASALTHALVLCSTPQVATNYPKLTVQPIAGLTQAGLLRAVANGDCVGAVGPDVELEFGMGGPGIFDADGFDPQKSYCGLTTVGPLLNAGYYGIPISKNDTARINPTTIDAMNVHVINAVVRTLGYGILLPACALTRWCRREATTNPQAMYFSRTHPAGRSARRWPTR